jgi:hypothetical protein
MAVLFWTGEYAFWTADIDVVMVVSDELHDRLAELGLERSADGRHWELPGTEVFVEAPSSALDPEARVKEVSLPSGRVARVLSRVDVLLARRRSSRVSGIKAWDSRSWCYPKASRETSCATLRSERLAGESVGYFGDARFGRRVTRGPPETAGKR